MSDLERGANRTRIYDLHARRFVDEDALVAGLVRARYRLLGEMHDDAAHHAIRARLLTRMANAGAHPAVVMEQFDLDADGALQAAQRSGTDAEALATAGRLDRKGWAWPLHAPIVAAALASRLPIRAGNLPRRELERDLDAVLRDHPRVAARLGASQWSDRQAQALGRDIVEGHCHMLPAAIVPRLVRAQRIRDAAMAQALVDDATADGAVLIAGNAHVRSDLGVPVYLHSRGQADAAAGSVSVGFVEVDDNGHEPEAMTRAISAHREFDYLWLTPAIERRDPCAAFHDVPKD